MATRAQILVRGVVQGVGFRPYIFSLARRRALRGQVFNNASGVLTDVEGETNAVEQFICVNCGPRFTIIEDMPYDRANTTMREFTMCGDCRAEYENPLDRRFHTEPTACAACGPRLSLTDASGRELATGDEAIGRARGLILNGKILVVKGVGGFHLACDATNVEAVERLRRRKYREDKPFALMADSIEAIEMHCSVSTFERDLLLSTRHPITLLARKPDPVHSNWPRAVAPGLNSLGFMLPYTPLHYLLLENLDRPLVMTSGNVSDEPICYEDQDALERLGAEFSDWDLDFVKRLDHRAWATLRRMAATGVNSPETSSMGRLFDAVASLIGAHDVASYEGQAAIELETLADESAEGGYEFEYSADIIKPSPVIGEIVADLVRRVPASVIAAKFHNAVAGLILDVSRRIRAERGLHRVALSGGVFQNRLLANRARRLLEAAGFEVFAHSRAPANDGGVSLGQAVVAGALIEADHAGRF